MIATVPLRYTRHARLRMKERRIAEEDVLLALAEPDELRYGQDGETIVVKKLGRRSIEIVFVETDTGCRIITVITR